MLKARNHSLDSEDWISVSDLMAGLMLVFLAVAIFFMREIQRDAARYQDTRHELYIALEDEFRDDLPRWNAELTEDLEVVFNEPDILFDQGEAALKERFTEILDDFFPRYVSVLRRFESSVEELRIEGHTSSEWTQTVSVEDAYFNNMRLSQDRTREVLRYVYLLPAIGPHRSWLKGKLTANGLSSSQPILTGDGIENRAASRRVTFQVRTNAEEEMRRLARSFTGAEANANNR